MAEEIYYSKDIQVEMIEFKNNQVHSQMHQVIANPDFWEALEGRKTGSIFLADIIKIRYRDKIFTLTKE